MPKGFAKPPAAVPQQVIIKPQSGPQMAFLSSDCDVVVYGGAAGG